MSQCVDTSINNQSKEIRNEKVNSNLRKKRFLNPRFLFVIFIYHIMNKSGSNINKANNKLSNLLETFTHNEKSEETHVSQFVEKGLTQVDAHSK